MKFLARLGFLSCGLLCAAVLAAAESRPARPNILWVVSEDNTANYVGAYGDPLARTPRIDALAREGILFTRAYAPAPVCAPTRSSIITGCYATSLGTQHMRGTQPLPPDVGFFPAYLRAAGYFTTNRAKTDYNTSSSPKTAWNENGASAHWRHRAPDQPFFAVFNFEDSHESRQHVRVPLITDPAKVRVPAYLPDTPTVRADLAQYYDNVSRADAAIGRVLDELAADGLADDTIIFYYSDNGGTTPRSKRFLYENGTHIALVARFPKKYTHLAPAPAGSRSAELVNFVDLAPTVLSLAGLPAPAYFQGRAFAGPARAPGPGFTHMFRDRMDERYDLVRAVTDGRWRYLRNYLPHLPHGQHLDYLWKQASMVEWEAQYRAGKLNPAQRAFFESRAPEELYDCTADPDNVHNLAADPAHAATLVRLRAANRAHLLRVRDAGFMPEGMITTLAAGGSPRAVARDDARYPLVRLLDLIDALQLSKAPAADLVAAARRDSLAVVRYWSVAATIGSPRAVDATALFKDPDPSVRVAAATAGLRGGTNPAAVAVLAGALASDQPFGARLAALNTLAFLPALPDAARPMVTQLAQTKDNTDYLGRAANALLAP